MSILKLSIIKGVEINNYLHYERAKKWTKTSGDKNDANSSTKTRSHFETKNYKEICFLCDESTKEALCRFRTFQVDKRIRHSARRLLDEKLLAKLSEEDLVATEACYHKNCLKKLYNRVRAVEANKSNEKRNEIMEGISLAKIEKYICHCIEVDQEVVHVVYLNELKELYIKRMSFHGCHVTYEHSTMFKEKLLKLIPELPEYKAGQDTILSMCEENAIEACDLQDDRICLARAASIIRKEILPSIQRK